MNVSMISKLKLVAGFLVPGLLLSLGFGCAEATLQSFMVSGARTDLGPTLNAYRQLVHPILVQNCSSCHAGEQPPLHSANDVEFAYNTAIEAMLIDIENIERSRLIKKIESGHNCWYGGNCQRSADEMLAALQNWRTKAGADLETDHSNVSYMYTSAQVIPPGIMLGEPIEMTFNISNISGIAGSQFSVDVEISSTTSFTIFNPRISSPQDMEVQRIDVFLNDARSPYDHTFAAVDEIVPANSPEHIIYEGYGAMTVLMEEGPGQDTIKIGFQKLGKGTPQQAGPSTFADVRNLLNRQTTCMGCHAGNDFMTPLSNNDQNTFVNFVKNGQALVVPGNPEGSLLYQAVTRTTDRMPTSRSAGRPNLNNAELEILRSWISNLSP